MDPNWILAGLGALGLGGGAFALAASRSYLRSDVARRVGAGLAQLTQIQQDLLAADRAQNAALTAQVAALGAQNSALRVEVAGLRADTERCERDRQAMEERLADLTRDLEAAYAEIAQLRLFQRQGLAPPFRAPRPPKEPAS